jgi:predicted permease
MDQRAASGFAGVAAYGNAPTLTVGSGADAHQFNGALVTGNYWSVLGVAPAFGRFFTESEDVRGGEPVVVISYGHWQRQYGGARDVLGGTVDFGHGAYTIVGVAPKGFTGAELSNVDLWLPLHIAAYQLQGEGWELNRQWWWLRGVARVAPGVPLERVQAEASGIFRNGRREYIERGQEDAESLVMPASLIAARGPSPAPEAQVAKWLTAVSVLVLLIACANVANLLLARAIRQRRETGIRLALGISRRRLAGQMLAEGLVLAAMGALAALAVTQWGGGLVQRTLLPDVVWGSAVSRQVLLFVIGVTLLAGLISALVPALQATRSGVAGALRESSGGITRSATRTRALLSLVQASLSVVLLVGAGLFVRSLNRVQSVDLGFEPERLLIANPVFVTNSVTPAEKLPLFERLQGEVNRLPTIGSAATTQMVPFWGSMAVALKAEGLDSVPMPSSGGPYVYPVSHDFLRTMGIEIRRGRAFEPGDRKGAPQVAVINESMARTLWPSEEALGKCLYLGGGENVSCTRIVGVAENAHRQNVREGEQLVYYVPLEQEITGSGPNALLLRVRGDLSAAAEAARAALLATDSRVRFAQVRPLQELIDPQLRSWKLGATMFSVFGLLAVVVAAIGLYSVLSFDVAQRTREIGLRSALGASRSSILAIFISRALRLTALGTFIGVLAALALAPRIEDLLFETSARDPLTVGAVVTALLAVALVAASVPALRAARVDPNVALRAD